MHRRIVRRKTVINTQGSTFQIGFKKYAACRRCTRRLIIDEAFSGGPAGLLYGFLIVWAGTAAVFASLGELVSMYASNQLYSASTKLCRAPTAGGQYYWVSMLAPRSSRKFFSYVTGRFKSLRSNLAGADELQAGSQLGGGRLMSRRSPTFLGRSSKG